MPKLRLLFDVSCLGYGSLGPQHRTGLFQVAAAYLEELKKHPDVDLGLYSSSGNRLLASRVLTTLGWNRQPWVGSRIGALILFSITALEFAVYRSPVRGLAPVVSRLKALAAAVRNKTDRRALGRWKAYLSPMESVPQSVREAGLTTSLVVHDLIPLVLSSYRQDPTDPTRWFAEMWRTTRTTDVVFAVSESTRQDWLRLRPGFPEGQIQVALNAFDPRRFRHQENSGNGRYFLAVSTVEPRKRVDAILSGYRAYRSAGGTTPLWIGGKDKTGRLQASEGVRLLGFIDDADLPGLYAACTAFLSFSEYEGFGLPILEAMACGSPVIVSNRTSHPEVAGDAGVYIDPDDLPAIAKALARLDRPGEREALSRKSLEQAQRFDWNSTVAAVVARLKKECE